VLAKALPEIGQNELVVLSVWLCFEAGRYLGEGHEKANLVSALSIQEVEFCMNLAANGLDYFTPGDIGPLSSRLKDCMLITDPNVFLEKLARLCYVAMETAFLATQKPSVMRFGMATR
jgi:hypothetical protein